MSFVYAVQYLLLSNSPQSVVILSLNKYSRKTPSVPDLYGERETIHWRRFHSIWPFTPDSIIMINNNIEPS